MSPENIDSIQQIFFLRYISAKLQRIYTQEESETLGNTAVKAFLNQVNAFISNRIVFIAHNSTELNPEFLILFFDCITYFALDSTELHDLLLPNLVHYSPEVKSSAWNLLMVLNPSLIVTTTKDEYLGKFRSN